MWRICSQPITHATVGLFDAALWIPVLTFTERKIILMVSYKTPPGSSSIKSSKIITESWVVNLGCIKLYFLPWNCKVCNILIPSSYSKDNNPLDWLGIECIFCPFEEFDLSPPLFYASYGFGLSWNLARTFWRLLPITSHLDSPYNSPISNFCNPFF